MDNAKNELFLSVRENMKVRRFERIEGKCVPYVHMKGKVAVLVGLVVLLVIALWNMPKKEAAK